MENATYIDDFLKHLQSHRRYSVHTVEAYAKDLRAFNAFLIDDSLTVKSVQQQHIRGFVVHLSKKGTLEKRTINRYLSAVKSFYKWMVEQGIRADNPTAVVKSVKTPKKVIMSVPVNDLEKLFDTPGLFAEDFEGQRDRLMMELLYGLGIRRSELIGLKLAHFDRSRKYVRVLGKRKKERQIPVPDPLWNTLDKYLILRESVGPGSDHLLLTLKGKPLYAGLVYKRVMLYLQSTTTVVDKSPHVLRHSYATHLLNNGVDINTLKELLGHSSIGSTQVYTQSSFEELVRVYNKTHPKGS